MQISQTYQDSQLKKGIDFLFKPNLKFNLKKSVMAKILPGTLFPAHAQIALITAIGILWYEGFWSGTPGFGILDVLPPILVFLSMILMDKNKLKVQKYHLWYVAFLGVAAVSALFASANGLDYKMLLLGWFILAQPLLAMLVGQSFKKNPTVLLGLLFMPPLGLGLLNYFRGSGYGFSSLESVGVRAASIFGGPNVFGMICGLLLILFVCEWTCDKRRHAFYYVALALGLALSFSRTAWLATGVALFVLAVFKNRKFIYTIFLAPFAFVVPRVKERVGVVFSEKYLTYASIDGRIWAINNGLEILRKSPILGTGPGSFGGKLAEMYSSPVALWGLQQGYPALATTDNQWMSLLVQTGIVGAASFLGFVAAFTFEVFEKINAKKISAITILVFLLLCGIFSNVIEFGVVILPASLMLGYYMNGARR